jgi:hypothetical protein
LSPLPRISSATRDALQRAHELRAHDAELEQVLGRRVHVGAEVEDVRAALRRGQDGGDRGPVDSGECLEDEAGDGHERAGIARAHAGARRAVAHEVDRDAHRRILLRPQRGGEALVHLDHFGGVLYREPRAGARPQPGELALDGFLAPDQHARGGRIAPQQGERRGHGDLRPVIPSHAVDSDRDVHAQPSPEAGVTPGEPPGHGPHPRATPTRSSS